MNGAPADSGGTSRLRVVVGEIVERVGGLPAVRSLIATFEAYDRAGGGLTAAGLAYTSLLAILAGLLLIVSAIGFLVDDPAVRADIVDWIGRAVPPLEPIASAALESVSAGSVPSGIVAIIGLLWGSSRLYAGMDYAFTRIFADGKPRNEIERTARGIFLVLLVVALPLLMLVVGSLARWLLDLAPGLADLQGFARSLLTLSTPLGSMALFVLGTVLVYRFVPSITPSMRVLLPPALLVGLVLAVFAQLFTFIGPLLGGVAAIYGAFVTLFALLAWLSISFNLLLMGAALTRVRARAASQPAPPADPSTPPPAERAAEAEVDAEAEAAD
jgi:YihY family inner membrane protein